MNKVTCYKLQVTRKGFTLIEVLVFVTILSIFFVTALSVTVASLRNMQINEHKIMASKYAEELMDWLRSQKEDNWKTFYSKNTTGSYKYCFSSLSWPTKTTTCTTPITGTIFTRQATLPSISGNQIDIKVTVTWSEVGNTYSVPLETIVSVWE